MIGRTCGIWQVEGEIGQGKGVEKAGIKIRIRIRIRITIRKQSHRAT